MKINPFRAADIDGLSRVTIRNFSPTCVFVMDADSTERCVGSKSRLRGPVILAKYITETLKKQQSVIFFARIRIVLINIQFSMRIYVARVLGGLPGHRQVFFSGSSRGNRICQTDRSTYIRDFLSIKLMLACAPPMV